MSTYPLIKKETYKRLEYTIHFSTNDNMFHGYCEITGDGSHSESIEAVEIDMEMFIDEFERITPSSWVELADMLTNRLVWTSYEDAHVEADTLKPLIRNFVKAGHHKDENSNKKAKL